MASAAAASTPLPPKRIPVANASEQAEIAHNGTGRTGSAATGTEAPPPAAATPAPTPPTGGAGADGSAPHKYQFKVHAPASLTYRDIGDCGWQEFDNLPARLPVPLDTPMLLVIGQQKGGTTWLYDVLKQHPAVVLARDLGCVQPRPACRTPVAMSSGRRMGAYLTPSS